MEQFLPRGYQVSPDKRITRIVAEGNQWQIYLTNMDSYVLAVKETLYAGWLRQYSLPKGIFSDADTGLCWAKVFTGSSDYLISSLEKGPYPKNDTQIEAFSIAFKAALEVFQNPDISDAIYIEEYSLLLPVASANEAADIGYIYGRWLTGGVNISINSFCLVSKIMSWLPEEKLKQLAQMAGFPISDEELERENSPMQNVAQREHLPATDLGKPAVQVDESFHLAGRPELERFFNDNIIDVVLHREQYQRMGITFPGATILYGPPGCGKTYAVDRLAEYLGWQRFDIDASTIASSYIHDTSKKISQVFRAAEAAAPSILVIDEMEAFLSDRSMSGPASTHHVEEVAEFLRRIPEVVSAGVLVFAMTNMLDKIDPAVLRRGRFDYMIEVKMASAEEIEQMLKSEFAKLPVEETVKTEDIAAELAGHPLSDISFVIREAGRLAVKRGCEYIDTDCFADALAQLPKKKEHTKIGFGNA
jgi:hypothetical protein